MLGRELHDELQHVSDHLLRRLLALRVAEHARDARENIIVKGGPVDRGRAQRVQSLRARAVFRQRELSCVEDGRDCWLRHCAPTGGSAAREAHDVGKSRDELIS